MSKQQWSTTTLPHSTLWRNIWKLKTSFQIWKCIKVHINILETCKIHRFLFSDSRTINHRHSMLRNHNLQPCINQVPSIWMLVAFSIHPSHSILYFEVKHTNLKKKKTLKQFCWSVPNHTNWNNILYKITPTSTN